MASAKLRHSAYAIILLCLLATKVEAKSKVPDWLDSAKSNADAYERFDEDDEALVLHSSMLRTYKGRGSIESRVRKAIHLKTRDRRDLAYAAIPISNTSQRITSFNAWLVLPSGKVETFRKNDLATIAVSQEALFSEAMVSILDRSYSARNDSIFAYEYTVSEKSIFLQTGWTFQEDIPTLHSEITLELPKGWSAEGYIMNSEGVEASSEGSTYQWVGRNLPSVKEEPSRPTAELLHAAIGITIQPSQRDLRHEKTRIFKNWNEVAKYGDEVQIGSLAASDAIHKKAQELTKSKTSRWEKIRAICQYTQSVNYVAIEMDLNSGGGYKPHKASDIFENHYGDCKDMTVLTRAMLNCVNIPSYATLASVGGDTYVHDNWASPHQFNHCIVAIPVDEEIASDAIIDHPNLGPTLIFDPTQKYIPIGDLPNSLQGTKILVSSEKTDTLTELPLPSKNRETLLREVDVEIQRYGNIKGTIKEKCGGSFAEYLRYLHRSSSEYDFKESITAWIARGTREATINKIKVIDDFENNHLELIIEFEADRYARLIGNDRIAIAPVFLSRREWVPPTEDERQSDYMVQAWSLDETTRINYPDNLEFETAPPAFEKAASFAEYSIESSQEGRTHTVRRKMSASNEIVPKERYAEVVEFYEQVSRADSKPIVLKWSRE